MGAASRKLRVVPPAAKAAFPSRRQKLCKGLKPTIYPDYVRQMVDYDYLGKLSDEEKQWLSAFSEEYYKGWRMREETQVNPLDKLRASNAAYKRLRLSGDPVAFPGHRGGRLEDQPEIALAASGRGQESHELRGRNSVEDEMIRWLDRPKRVR